MINICHQLELLTSLNIIIHPPLPLPSSPISHLPSSLPLTILFPISAWCDGDEKNDEGITQQLGHNPSIERYNIIEPP